MFVLVCTKGVVLKLVCGSSFMPFKDKKLFKYLNNPFILYRQTCRLEGLDCCDLDPHQWLD